MSMGPLNPSTPNNLPHPHASSSSIRQGNALCLATGDYPSQHRDALKSAPPIKTESLSADGLSSYPELQFVQVNPHSTTSGPPFASSSKDPNRSSDNHIPTRRNTAPSTFPGPQLPSHPHSRSTTSVIIDTIFHDTYAKLRALEYYTKQTIQTYDRERVRWKNHCVSLKEQRDFVVMQASKAMMGAHAAATPVHEHEAADAHQAVPSATQRKAARETRKHTPYEVPASRRSNAIDPYPSPTPDDWNRDIHQLHAPRSPATPPPSSSSSCPPERISPPISACSSSSSSTSYEAIEDLTPRRLTEDPSTSPSDVPPPATKRPEGFSPWTVKANLRNQPTVVGYDPNPRPFGRTVQDPVQPGTLSVHHNRAMYAIGHGKLWCRACLFQRSQAAFANLADPSAAAEMEVFTLPAAASFSQISEHWLDCHPAECEGLVKMTSEMLVDFVKAMEMPFI